MKKIEIHSEYITLGQFLKFTDVISSGAMAKMYLSDNVVYVNGVEENRRGRKLYVGDEIELENMKFVIGNQKWFI